MMQVPMLCPSFDLKTLLFFLLLFFFCQDLKKWTFFNQKEVLLFLRIVLIYYKTSQKKICIKTYSLGFIDRRNVVMYYFSILMYHL